MQENILIRNFSTEDANQIVEILKANGQFAYPDIEGPDAMKRAANCASGIFLVAEIEGNVEGIIRAFYDGARAFIHLISISPSQQRSGIGSALLKATEAELKRRGAPGAAVTVNSDSVKFWEKTGYKSLGIDVRLKSGWSDPNDA